MSKISTELNSQYVSKIAQYLRENNMSHVIIGKSGCAVFSGEDADTLQQQLAAEKQRAEKLQSESIMRQEALRVCRPNIVGRSRRETVDMRHAVDLAIWGEGKSEIASDKSEGGGK